MRAINCMKDWFVNKRVLVTGGGGFIGSYVVQELVQRKAKIDVMLDEEASRRRLDFLTSQVRVHRVSDWSEAALASILKDIKPQIIFHLRAAINQVPGQASREHFFQVNVHDTKELAQAALGLGLEAFVNAGTIAEYGATSAPFREDKEAKPISEYGESKLAATLWLKSFHEAENFPAILMRSSVVYGPGQTVHSYLVPNVIMNCLQKRDFQIKSSGLQTRDPLFISDDVDGLLLAAATPQARGEIINLGLGEEYAVLAIARLINEQLGNPVKIITGSLDDRHGENQNYWHDINKAKRLLGWRPKVSLEEGINKTVSWYREHYNDFI